MIPLPFSIILLSLVTLLVYLGFAQRVLDRMRLNDKTAIILLAFLIVAHFIPPIQVSPVLAINLGAFVPLGIVVYLLVTTSSSERLRSLLLSVTVASLLWLTDRFFPLEPGGFLFDIDPLYIPGLLGGFLAYVTTRSRRSAFVSAVLGVFLLDLLATLVIFLNRHPQQILIGGGGVFDALLLSGILAVAIAEIIGEIRERIYRGPAKIDNPEDGDDSV